jgi:putative ABC transport system ATP-binding protein
MSDEYVVIAEDLRKIYGDGGTVRALDGINLKIRRGELIAVMGHQEVQDAPEYSWRTRPPIQRNDSRGRARYCEDERFGSISLQDGWLCFQLHNLIPTLTAVENIEIPL